MDIDRPICSSHECPGKNPVRRKGWRVDKSPIWGSLCGNCHRKATGQRRTPGKRGKMYNRSKEAKDRCEARRRLRCSDELARFKEFDIKFRGGCQNNLCGLVGLLLPHRCYDYHHLDYSTKVIEIGKVKRFNELVKLEVLKCAILCACCHRLIHHNPELVDLCVMSLDGLFSSYESGKLLSGGG